MNIEINWGILIASMMALIAAFQLTIASSKLKLDLYNKRFHIYESVLNLYQQAWKWEEEKIRPLELELIRSLRESKYLFNEKDEIYETIIKVKNANAKISGYHRTVKEFDTLSNPERFNILHKTKVDGFDEFEKNLYELEEKLKKYISFKNINGLDGFLSRYI